MSVGSKRIHCITRAPRVAQNIPVEVKLTFLIDVFGAAIPLFENKNPTNPEGGTSTTA